MSDTAPVVTSREPLIGRAEELVDTAPAVGAGTVFYQGSAARVIAELELGAGEPAAAIPRFEEGIRVDTLLGARPYMPGLLRAADAFLADAQAKARAADPLTRREREIVELVAQALPNREIARQLVLKPRQPDPGEDRSRLPDRAHPVVPVGR